MRVTALHNTDEANRALTVSTGSGSLQGLWRGPAPICAGDTLDVELELRRPRRWSDLVIDGEWRKVSDSEARLVRGDIAEVFEDGVIALRIGTATILLEMIGDAPKVPIGTSVSLLADDLEFHPTGM